MSIRRSFEILGGALVVFWAWGGGLYAQPTTLGFSITADTMTARHDDQHIVFSGNVVLKNGTFTLKTDILEVEIQSGPEGNLKPGQDPLSDPVRFRENVSHIEARGHVHVAQGDRQGKADHAIYDRDQERVTLTGNPEIWSRDYRLTGTTMIFDLRDHRNIVEDSEAIIFPQ